MRSRSAFFVEGIGVKVLWSIILISLSVFREQPVTGLAWQNQLTPGISFASARQLQIWRIDLAPGWCLRRG